MPVEESTAISAQDGQGGGSHGPFAVGFGPSLYEDFAHATHTDPLDVRQLAVTISIKPLARGEGLKYLMESVVRGDGAVGLTSPLSRYYAESGTPPGRFLGGGLAFVNGGQGVAVGTEVGQDELAHMLSVVGDPITGELLGARSRSGAASATGSQKLAGFDLTFSLPKSISTAWALADAGTQALIYQAHQDAIAETIAYAERHTFFSRSGANGVVQESIEGVIAAAFDHWDSRAGDPQLHTHVVVENLAKTTRDGKWRTIDSRALFKQVVTLSEMHQGIVQDLLAERLGWGFDARQRQHSTVPKWEVAGVSDAVQREFSQRSSQLLSEKDRLVEDFIAYRGRTPTNREVIKLRQRATLTTRPDKHHHSLAEQTDQWRQRARRYVGGDTVAFVLKLAGQGPKTPRLRLDDLTPAARDEVANRVIRAVGDVRSTYTRANLVAETHRQMHGWRFADPTDRLAGAEAIADAAETMSILLTPVERLHVPARFRNEAGVSRFTPATSRIFTTAAVIKAEERLLAAGRALTGVRVAPGTVAHVTSLPLPGKAGLMLSDDQAYAVERVATSGRTLDVLVGPAGTGKSTSMLGLRTAWEAEHGPGSVVGLAPSAAAADVLADELGIPTENTAKWLYEHDKTTRRLKEAAKLHAAEIDLTRPSSARRRAAATSLAASAAKWQFKADQLVIVDEASLAGTFSLDRIVSAAKNAGAKVLLVGDWAQLSAVEVGGAFSMLVADRNNPDHNDPDSESGMAPELTDVRRFRNDWEKAASVELRTGRSTAIDIYTAHGRVHGGDRDSALEQLYGAWRSDVAAGKTSLMIAGDRAAVADLNARARADLVDAGVVEEKGLRLTGWTVAGVGDQVITRHNERTLAIGGTWVKNGDRWIVTDVNHDGSMTVQRHTGAGSTGTGGAVVLPAGYVAEHVELGYAVTAHRAQGATVDTAHSLATATTTREVLYVAATRGREANHLYVDTTHDPDPDTSHGKPEQRDVHQVLEGILANTGTEAAATVTAQALAGEHQSLTHLYREYASIAREADTDHWARVLDRVSGTADGTRIDVDELTASPSWPTLAHTLRDLDGRGLDPHQALEAVLPHALTARDPAADTAQPADPAARLVAALRTHVVETADGPPVPRDRSVLGLLAYPHVSSPDLKRGLDERAAAMRERAQQPSTTPSPGTTDGCASSGPRPWLGPPGLSGCVTHAPSRPAASSTDTPAPPATWLPRRRVALSSATPRQRRLRFSALRRSRRSKRPRRRFSPPCAGPSPALRWDTDRG